MSHFRRLASAGSWGILDQAIYSIGSLLLGVSAARAGSAQEFGNFSIAYLIAVLLVGCTRAVAGQPLVMLYSGISDAASQASAALMLRFILRLGLGLGAILIAIGLLSPPSLTGPFVALGLVVPGVLLQDGYRFALFAGGRGRSAVICDAIWLFFQVAATVGLAAFGQSSPVRLLAAWGMSAAIAATWAAASAKISPFRVVAGGWASSVGELWRPLSIDALLQELPRQISGFAVAAWAGPAELGSLRGAQVLFGPVTTTAGGIRLAFLPAASVSVRDRGGTGRLEAVAASLIIGAVAVLSLLFWLLVPDGLGMRALGSTWTGSAALVPAIGLGLLLQGASVGGQIQLLAHAAAGAVARRRAVVAALQAVGSTLGAYQQGAMGAALGLAAANALALVVWWLPARTDRTIRL